MDNDFREIDFVSGKSTIKIILMVLFVILLIGGGFLYYYLSTRPIKMFESLIDDVVALVNNDKNVKKNHYDLDLNFKFLGEDTKEINDLLSKFSFKSKGNLDFANNIYDIDMILDYNEKNMILADVYYQNSYIYLDLHDLYNKLIKVDVDKYLESEVNDIDVKDFNLEDFYIILEEELNAFKYALDEGEFSKERIRLNGEYVYKSTLTLTSNNYKAFLDREQSYLSNNDRYKGAVSRFFGESYEEMNEEKNYDLEYNIIISLYTKGIKNELVKFDIYEGNKEILNVNLDEENKLSFNYYDEELSLNYNLFVDGDEITISGTTSSDELKLDMLVKISDFNGKIETPNLDNAILSDIISDEAVISIYEKLYEKEGFLDLYNELISRVYQYYDEYNEEGEINV